MYELLDLRRRKLQMKGFIQKLHTSDDSKSWINELVHHIPGGQFCDSFKTVISSKRLSIP